MKNYKAIGGMGERAVIGKLARFGVDVALPMSDNLPFDLIVIGENKLFKVQVKSSSRHSNNHVAFSIKSVDFYKSSNKSYTEKDCDLIMCYDLILDNIYLLEPKDFVGKTNFYINIGSKPQSNSNCGDDYKLDKEKIFSIFGVKTFDWENYNNRPKNIEALKSYDHKCDHCGDKFVSGRKKSRFCSRVCFSMMERKVSRPDKDELERKLLTMSLEALGRDYGVTGNSVRKWAKSYGLVTPTRKNGMIKIRECQYCHLEFKPIDKKSKFCSTSCVALSSRRVDRPSKEILESEMSVMSWREIGEKYGVIGPSVRKWAKSYGIVKKRMARTSKNEISLVNNLAE